MFDPEARPQAVFAARTLFVNRYKEFTTSEGGCLYWAAAMAHILRRDYDYNDAILQAGSAQWRFVSKVEDDGKQPTHFGYVWETPMAIARLAQGMLPEMHVWLVLNVRQGYLRDMELVDLTTCFQPAQAKRLNGFDWSPNCPAPPYLWSRMDDLPAGDLYYEPNEKATKLAQGLLLEFHKTHRE